MWKRYVGTPKVRRSKLDQKWRYGVVVGRSLGSDQNHIALSDGSMTRARAMVKLVRGGDGWNFGWLVRLKATPLTEHSKLLDGMETSGKPHASPPLICQKDRRRECEEVGDRRRRLL